MDEQYSASGAAMCFFGWELLEERECNIGAVAALTNSGSAFDRRPVKTVVIRL